MTIFVPSSSIPFVDATTYKISDIWHRFLIDFGNSVLTVGGFGTGYVVATGSGFTTRNLTNGDGSITITNGSGLGGDTNFSISASWSGSTSITTLGTVSVGAWNATAIGAIYGGTGLAAYNQGDLIYANGANTLTTLAKNTTATRYLANTGTSNNPAWAQVDLTTGVTNTLPVGNGGTGVTAYPAARAYCSTNQSIGTGAHTKIQFDTETYDTNNNFDSTTNFRFTPTIAGKYQVNLVVHITLTAAAYSVQASIYKNGSAHGIHFNNITWTANAQGFVVSDILDMNGSTDFIEGFIFQASGGNRTLLGGSTNCYISISRIAT